MDITIDQTIDKMPYYKKLTDDKIINLTGESGAGKSTFSNIYKQNEDFIVVDYDRILSPEEGTIEYELKNAILKHFGIDFFDRMKHSSFDDMRHMFTDMYEFSIEYLKLKNKIIVLDGSQLRYIDDVTKIKGQVIALRPSINTCVERAINRQKEKNPNITLEELKAKRIKKTNELQRLTPFLNNILVQIESLNIGIGTGKEEYIINLIDMLMNKYPDIPREIIDGFKKRYLQDDRDLETIQKEIILSAKEIDEIERIVNRPIPQEVLDNSILLIGPMATGKSTISKGISQYNNMPFLSLDENNSILELRRRREQLGKNFKRYEFFEECSILTSLTEPSVIDFGGGHSNFENPLMFYYFKKLISKFKNVYLILPSQNLDESIAILGERLKQRDPSNYESNLQANERLVKSPQNYELAKKIIYTKGKDLLSIIEEINKIYFYNNDDIKGDIKNQAAIRK